MSKLSWLAGSWGSAKGDVRSEEHWMVPSKDIMLGMNRTTENGMTKQYESLRIERRDDGLYYVAFPSGQKSAAFKLVKIDDSSAEFANPAHDFPKRIIYQRDGRTLLVRISGNPGDRTAEWLFRRMVLPSE